MSVIHAEKASDSAAIGRKPLIPLQADDNGQLIATSALNNPTKNEASGQTDGTTYYYLDMETYRYVAYQIEDTPGAAGDQTYTVEASLQDDGTAEALCAYDDVTLGWYGVANLTTSGIFMPNQSVMNIAKYVRIKVVRANDAGNNDGAWTIHPRQIW